MSNDIKQFITTLIDNKGQEYYGKVYINGEYVDAPDGTKCVLVKAEDCPVDMKGVTICIET